MSELYVSTSMGEYVIAAVMGTRRSFYHTEKGAANLDGFFECFAKLKEEFPLPSLRKIFVEIGPGSFTGVRVGVTFARMLSQQLRIPLVPMKALDIVAAGDFASGGETARTGALMVAPLLDTGNGFVYGAVFRPGESCGDIYAVEISEWLDYVQSLGGKICLCGRVSPRDEEILKNRELPFRKLETADIIENMITLSARGPLETPSRSGAPEPRSSAPYGEVTPVYINRKEAEEKWQEKLEDEMVKIAELVEKKEGVINEIKNLEKLKHEKEKDIEDIGLLSEKTDSARRELASSMDELSILSAKRTAYTESISAKEKKIAEYEKKLEELKSRSRDCERELALREAKYEKIKELPPEIPREVELYIQQRDELKAEVEDLKKEKSSCSGELDDIATSRFEEVFERIKTEEAMMEDLSVKRRQKEEQIKSLEERLREIARKSALAENELEERIVSAGKFDGRAASVEEEKPDSRETSPEEPAPPEEPEQEEIYASSASPSDEALPSASDVQPATADVQHPSGRDTAEKEAENAETLSAAAAILPLRDVFAEEPSSASMPDNEAVVPKPADSIGSSDRKQSEGVNDFKQPEKSLTVEPLKKMEAVGLDYMVRPFRLTDLSDVMRIEEASFERPWRRQMFKEEMAIPVSKLYMLFGRWSRRDQTALMAYSVFWIVSEKAHIINFAVAPAERHKGLGSVLLFEILKKAVALGCKSAYLEVRASAKYAHKLLVKSGFGKISERKDYFGYPREDAFIYERKLQ